MTARALAVVLFLVAVGALPAQEPGPLLDFTPVAASRQRAAEAECTGATS